MSIRVVSSSIQSDACTLPAHHEIHICIDRNSDATLILLVIVYYASKTSLYEFIAHPTPNLSLTISYDSQLLCKDAKASSSFSLKSFISHGLHSIISSLLVISLVPPTSVATTIHHDNNASTTVVGRPS